jgi:hypothetical protein
VTGAADRVIQNDRQPQKLIHENALCRDEAKAKPSDNCPASRASSVTQDRPGVNSQHTQDCR